MNTNAHVYERSQAEDAAAGRSVMTSVFLSMALHVAVIAALVVSPWPSQGNRLPPGALSVRLVSLPGPSAGDGKAAAAAPRPALEPITEKPAQIEKLPTVPLPEPEPEPEPIRQPPPAPAEPPAVVSTAPPKETLKSKASLKKQTKDPQKIIADAIRRIEKEAGKPPAEQRSVDTAIERLKKQVAEAEARKLQPYRPQSDTGVGTGAAGGGGGGGAGGAIRLVDIYRVEIASQIEKNWAYPRQLAGNAAGLEARLEFKVLPSGEITDIRFDARSNNASMDDSAYKAIVKSNPVSPHPPGLSLPYVMVGIRFTPEGLN